MRSVLFGLVQLAGGVAALAGLYLLVGLAWTLLAGGVVALVVFTALEAISERSPVVPEPAPEPVSELEGLRSTARKPELEPVRTAELED